MQGDINKLENGEIAHNEKSVCIDMPDSIIYEVTRKFGYKKSNENYQFNAEDNQNSAPSRGDYTAPLHNMSAQNIQVYVVEQVSPTQNAATRGAKIQDPREHDQQVDSDDSMFGRTFDNRVIRHQFIRKVYLCLTVELVYTTGVIALCAFEKSTNRFMKNNFWIMFGVFFAWFLVVYLILSCNKKARRSVPCNYILLTFLTIFLSIWVGTLSAVYSKWAVMAGWGTTFIITLVITFIAWLNCIDMTKYVFYLVLASILLGILGLICFILSFFMNVRILHLVFCAIGVVVTVMWLWYSTQQIIGGKGHRTQLNPEDYIEGNIELLIDIVYIYVYLLPLFDAC